MLSALHRKCAPKRGVLRGSSWSRKLAYRNQIDNISQKRAPKFNRKEYLCWLDLEMTGLDYNTDHILEMAAVITTEDLRIIAQSPNIIIHQTPELLASMNEWCQKQHNASGLVLECLESQISEREAENLMIDFIAEHLPIPTAISNARRLPPRSAAGAASCATVPFDALNHQIDVDAKVTLAGDSVHQDRAFLIQRMPILASIFSHRLLDISTLAEISKRWFPKEYQSIQNRKRSSAHRSSSGVQAHTYRIDGSGGGGGGGAKAHRALDDILESIEVLRWYKREVLKESRKF